MCPSEFLITKSFKLSYMKSSYLFPSSFLVLRADVNRSIELQFVSWNRNLHVSPGTENTFDLLQYNNAGSLRDPLQLTLDCKSIPNWPNILISIFSFRQTHCLGKKQTCGVVEATGSFIRTNNRFLEAIQNFCVRSSTRNIELTDFPGMMTGKKQQENLGLPLHLECRTLLWPFPVDRSSQQLGVQLYSRSEACRPMRHLRSNYHQLDWIVHKWLHTDRNQGSPQTNVREITLCQLQSPPKLQKWNVWYQWLLHC